MVRGLEHMVEHMAGLFAAFLKGYSSWTGNVRINWLDYVQFPVHKQRKIFLSTWISHGTQKLPESIWYNHLGSWRSQTSLIHGWPQIPCKTLSIRNYAIAPRTITWICETFASVRKPLNAVRLQMLTRPPSRRGLQILWEILILGLIEETFPRFSFNHAACQKFEFGLRLGMCLGNEQYISWINQSNRKFNLSRNHGWLLFY